MARDEFATPVLGEEGVITTWTAPECPEGKVTTQDSSIQTVT